MSSDIRPNPDEYGVKTLLAYICKEHVTEGFGNISGPLEISSDEGQENARLNRLAEEFNRIIDLNADRTGVFLHCILSLQPGEDPSLEEWRQIYEKFFQRMGLGDRPYVAYLHRDTKVVHGHALVLTVGFEGKADLSYDRYRAQEICREIEREMGLAPVRSGWEMELRALPDGLGRRQFEANQKSDVSMPLVKLVELRDRVDQVIQDYAQASPQEPLGMSAFIERLVEKDVHAEVTVCDGEPGIRYGTQFDQVPFWVQGRQLGPAYTFNGLQEFKGLVPDGLTALPVQRSQPPTIKRQDAVKTYLRNVVDLTLQGNPSLLQWLRLLSEWKVRVSLRYPQSVDLDQAADPTAVRYFLEGVDRSFSGTDLGGRYTFKGLQKRGLQHSSDEVTAVQAAIRPWERPVDATQTELSKSEAKQALRALLEAPLALDKTASLTLLEYLSRLQE
ncbi:MAG: relaxase/mobilization nuclease domain-containing protein, partial [Cyanobacteria bacterium J06636_16]